jgi:tRNA A-37 threonylcarbamoyl transferase component Bud32
MQYIEGKTLNQYIKRKYYYTYDESLNIIKTLFINIATTIDFLHKNNIVHTDIIGANIIIDNELKITIIDFDFALILNREIDGAVNIDIYGFIVMFSQILYEQIYLNKNYSLFNNNVITIKKNILKDFISQKGLKKYTTCMAFIDDIFKENNKAVCND